MHLRPWEDSVEPIERTFCRAGNLAQALRKHQLHPASLNPDKPSERKRRMNE